MSNFARRFGLLRDPNAANANAGGGGGETPPAKPADPSPNIPPTGGSDTAAELARLRRLADAQRVLMDSTADPLRQDAARSEILRQNGYTEDQIAQMRAQARAEAEAAAAPAPAPKKRKAAEPEEDDESEEESNPIADEIAALKAELDGLRSNQRETDVDRLKRDIHESSASNVTSNEFIQKLMTRKTPAQKAAALEKIGAQIRARTISHLRTMQGQSGSAKVNNAWVAPAVKRATDEISAELQAVLDGLDLGHAPETEPEVTTILSKPKVQAPKYKPGMDAEATASDYTANSLERLAAEQYHAGSKA